MIFTQYYLDCLSQASYLIGDEKTGRAVVVDPKRDIDEYIDDAAAAGLRIELVIETHFHADFVSGHLELARATGADIAYGSSAETEFPIRRLSHGERIDLGDVWLTVLETPGHTPESVSIVVYEHQHDDVPFGVLTGDTLFIGDVGRPDLLSSAGVTADELARSLYDSLHNKLLVLPDATRVYPAHGAGSACGKNLSTATVSTIGEQRATNYALAPMDVDAFTSVVTEGQLAAPGYFGFDAVRNRQAHSLLDEHEPPAPLTLTEVMNAVREGAVVLDTRDANDFAAGHLAGSVNVGLGGRFSEYAGSVIEPGAPVVLVCDAGLELEAKVRLARIGFDAVSGFLAEPEKELLAHPELAARASRVTADQLRDRLEAVADLAIVDVRNPGERAAGSVPGAVAIPLASLRARLGELDGDRPTVAYCAGGYRSAIAASVLRAAGFSDVSDLVGGYGAWAASERAITTG